MFPDPNGRVTNYGVRRGNVLTYYDRNGRPTGRGPFAAMRTRSYRSGRSRDGLKVKGPRGAARRNAFEDQRRRVHPQ